MIAVEFDLSDVTKYAQSLGAAADQIPYAIAIALNRSADVTRNFLIRETWPQHVQQRNASFIAASLTTRDARATKYSAAVEIYDKLDRGNLYKQAKGGTRAPRGGANLAIASSQITRTPHGVPTNVKPANLVNSFRVRDVIYQKDKRGRMRLMYVLKHQTPIPRRVPFYEDFAASMQRELTRTIPLAVKQAMSTRIVR